MGAETNLSSEQLKDIRRRCREMFGKTHDQRAEALAKDFPEIPARVLWACSRVSVGCSEKVWDFLIQGKATLFVIEEIIDIEIEAQDKLIDECLAKGVNLTFRRVRDYKKSGVLTGAAPKAEEKNGMQEKPAEPADASASVPARSGEKDISFEAKFTKEQILELRNQFLGMPHDWTHVARVNEAMKTFKGAARQTLLEYCRVCMQCTEKVWRLYAEDKTKMSIMSEICSMEKGDQDFFIDECVSKNLQPKVVRKIRQFRNEHGWGFPECIAKATGEVPVHQPRNEMGGRKTLDGLLAEIADKGARWRAMVMTAIEMVELEEAKAGVHEAIFTKVTILRELIKTQYEFVNTRFQRYMGMIRKAVKKGGVPAQADVEEMAEATPEPDVEPEQEPETPELAPIPEGEKKSFQDRAAQHEQE